MQTTNKKISSSGAEGKQRKLTLTSEKFQKLIRKNDETAAGTSLREGQGNKGDTEYRYRRTTERPKYSQNRNTDGQDSEVTRARRKPTTNIAATNREYILDLLQDINSTDTGPVKNPDEDCEMVTAIDNDSLTKIQFQLLEAARTNRCDILQMIIDQRRCRLDVKNNLDRTALHLAAAQGCFEAVKLLVEAHAPVDLPDKHGMSPMFWAAYNDHVEIVIYLIEHGASVQRKTKRGFTLLHVLAKSDSIKTMESLVRSKLIRNFQELDLNDFTPLMVATISGSLRATTVLSRIGSLETHLDKTKKNVFHLAVLSECPLVLEQLCKHDEMPKLINAFDDDHMAPIHYAVDLDDIDSTTILLKYRARVNIKSKNVPYPLITASHRGNITMMNLLLENRANIGKANFAGNTPLHIACMANEVEAAKFLLRKGADITALNKRFQIPFNAAVEQDSAEAAELLILAGTPLNEVDRAAKTPLMQSALSGFVRIVDMIIKAERWRLANPEMVATLANKYCRKREGAQEEDSEEDDEELDQPQDPDLADTGSRSISEASTYSSSQSIIQNSFHSCNSGDSGSISEAETYVSGSDDSADENTLEDPKSHSSELQLEGDDSVFNSQQQKTLSSETEAPSVSTQMRNVSFKDSEDQDKSHSAAPSRSSVPVSDARKSRTPQGVRQEPLVRSTPNPASTYSSDFQPEIQFLVNTQSYAGQFQTLFFYISHKKLHRGEWKSLAKYWDFKEEHVEAIELQHTGDRNAYKEHGFRLLCIWMHGLSETTDPAPLLYTALTSIGRGMDANNVQKDFYKAMHGKHSRKEDCHIS
ncbi:hypothetical protein Aperf_G00000107865 [Anoplocephala perfoliata]